MNNKLNHNLSFDELILVNYLKEKQSPFVDVIQKIFNEVKDILDTRISAIFPDYTLHNTSHSFRIINYMAKIVEDYKELSELEITLLICSALLHDIGMAVSDEDLKQIRADNFPFSDIKYSAMLRLVIDEKEATQEYVRRIHAQLSGRYIREQLKGKLIIPTLPSLDFADELALICESHTEDYDWIQKHLQTHEVRASYVFNPQFIAAILRLADILDIDGNRTPYRLYKLISPKGISDLEWLQHFVIFNNDKIIHNSRTHLRDVVFHGKAKSADIHRKILNYIDWVEEEFTGAMTLVAGMRNQYNLPFSEKPKVYIQPEGYTFSGYKMTLKYDAISALLMGEKIYGSKSLGLRELIQNSLDACRIRQEKEILALGEDPYAPKIKVILDENKNQVTVRDNGLGMSRTIIKNHFLNIGVSYYQSQDFLLSDYKYKPIGNFGIGFLSCFMLSDTVQVKTRHYQSKHQYLVQLEKGNEWTSLTEREDVNFQGTEVILRYDQFMKIFENKEKNINDFLRKYFLTDGIDFTLVSQSETLQIKNNLNDENNSTKGYTKIQFSDYLHEIEGYALLRKKENFITSLVDVPLGEEIYLYDPQIVDYEDEDYDNDWENLKRVDDVSLLRIEDYKNGDVITYVQIPIIENDIEDDFASGMKFTGDDIKEVIEKLDDKLKWITILVPRVHQKYLQEDEIDINGDVIEGVTFAHLEEIGQSNTCSTYLFVKKFNIFQGARDNLYLPFEVNDKPLWYYPSVKSRRELFIRNVLIKDFIVRLPIIASVFDVEEIVVNIKSRRFLPDISRNNLDIMSQDLINKLVGKAIHRAAIDHLNFKKEEIESIKDFIKKFYDYNDELENNQ